jgi:S-disulfanyl-L-cysteine oxidoreductase SoxD
LFTVHGFEFMVPRILVCTILIAPCALLPASGEQAARTVWDGVYTEAQAERGRTSYQQTCLSCHRDDLRGDSTAPSLVGESFLFLWGDMEVGELSARIQKVMPPERPGSLPAQTYTDIIAFILQKNAFPAGDTELPAESGTANILITSKRP